MGKKKSSGVGGFKTIMQSVADYTRETNKLLLILCIVASLFGCALILSAMRYQNNTRTMLTQLAAAGLGVVAAIFVSLFDYKTISKHPSIFMVLSLVLLIVTYQFGYAPEGTENKAWIELPLGMSLQVSEIIKVFTIITFSHHVQSLDKDEINDPKNVILLAIHGAAPAALVMILQKDLGTVIIMLCIFISMMFAAGVKARWFIGGFAAIAAASPFLWFFGLSDYQRQRFSIITNLESDAQGLGYQQLQGLNAIGSGGLFGEGYLNGSFIQTGSVPKAYNDFIFAVAGNELGFIGCIAVVGLLVAIVCVILWVGAHARDVEGKTICAGVFGMIASQMIINLGMVLSMLPVIGVTLPFFSAGGSSLIVLYVSVGLVLSVHKNRFKRQAFLVNI